MSGTPDPAGLDSRTTGAVLKGRISPGKSQHYECLDLARCSHWSNSSDRSYAGRRGYSFLGSCFGTHANWPTDPWPL